MPLHFLADTMPRLATPALCPVCRWRSEAGVSTVLPLAGADSATGLGAGGGGRGSGGRACRYSFPAGVGGRPRSRGTRGMRSVSSFMVMAAPDAGPAPSNMPAPLFSVLRVHERSAGAHLAPTWEPIVAVACPLRTELKREPNIKGLASCRPPPGNLASLVVLVRSSIMALQHRFGCVPRHQSGEALGPGAHSERPRGPGTGPGPHARRRAGVLLPCLKALWPARPRCVVAAHAAVGPKPARAPRRAPAVRCVILWPADCSCTSSASVAPRHHATSCHHHVWAVDKPAPPQRCPETRLTRCAVRMQSSHGVGAAGEG